MTEETNRLRVVVATPLDEALCRLIEQREPRIDLIRDQSLLPPMRHPADHSGDPDFHRSDAEQQRFEQLVDSADVLYGIPEGSARALKRTADANAKLRWVHTMAAGGGGQVRAAGLDAAQLERIAFTTSAGVHGGPLAEFAVFGIFAGAKHLPRLLAQQREHEWSGRWQMAQVEDLTVLVVGLGGIGRVVATKLSVLGARVIGTSRYSDSPVEGVDRIIHPDNMTDVLGEVDAIVVTLPGTEATDRMITASVFEAIKPGATLVSVGRGTVIDEEALIGALRSGRIGFAALDVFAVEPLAEDSPLWDLPNVVISPHTAALNEAEDRRIAELFARNATRLLDGEPLLNRVDTVEFY